MNKSQAVKEFEKEEKHRKRKSQALALQVVLVLILSVVAMYTMVVFHDLSEISSKTSWLKPTRSYADYEKDKTVVLGETDEKVVQMDDKTSLSSENFRLKQVSVGGEMLAEFEDDDSSLTLNIFDVKNELFVTKNKEEIKMLLTWKTNKTTKGFIEFAKEGDSNKKKVTIDNNGSSHMAVLAGLEPSSVYTYTITSVDRFGVEKQSDKYVFYTGAPNVSFMDVLEDAAKKTFGWAM